MPQHEPKDTHTHTQPQRKTRPRHILLTFRDPVTTELLEEVDRAVRYSVPDYCVGSEPHFQIAEAMYDDGFGRLVRTEPKGA